MDVQTERSKKNGSDAGTSDALSAALVGLGRGFSGALIFALPMLMTMEMWWLGF